MGQMFDILQVHHDLERAVQVRDFREPLDVSLDEAEVGIAVEAPGFAQRLVRCPPP